PSPCIQQTEQTSILGTLCWQGLTLNREDDGLKTHVCEPLPQSPILQPVLEQLFILSGPLESLIYSRKVILINAFPPVSRIYPGFINKALGCLLPGLRGKDQLPTYRVPLGDQLLCLLGRAFRKLWDQQVAYWQRHDGTNK